MYIVFLCATQKLLTRRLLLTDFVCLYNYEFGLSLCKIVRSSVILLLPLLINMERNLLEHLADPAI
jgi:hypothetical protein